MSDQFAFSIHPAFGMPARDAAGREGLVVAASGGTAGGEATLIDPAGRLFRMPISELVVRKPLSRPSVASSVAV
jgi:hypothetical protein